MSQGFQNVKLPSNCRIYKGVEPKDIFLKPLTGEEERILAETNVVNFDRKILEVLKNVVKGIDPSLLTLGDRLYIIIWEIMNSFSDELSVTYVCRSCGFENKTVGKFSSMEVIELPNTFICPIKVELTDGRTIHVRLLTAGDEAKISDYENTNKEDSWVYRYALSIVNNDDILKRMELYKSLSVKDTAKIRSVQEEFYHGPDMQFRLTCKDCGKEELIPIPFRVGLLLPTGQELVRAYGSRVRSHVTSQAVSS